MPESQARKPCSEAAMPRRVGNRSSVIREIDGIAMAKPMPKTMSGITAHGTEGIKANEYARLPTEAIPMKR